MLLQSWLALVVALLFYLVIPVLGALLVRKKWRDFRSQLFHASLLPRLRSETVFRYLHPEAAAPTVDGAEPSSLGLFAAYGTIDAIGPENRIWLRLDGATCSVQMDGEQVHTLFGARDAINPSLDPETDTVERLSWRTIPSIPQGTRLFVAGALVRCAGSLCFRSTSEQALLVILHDGIDDYVLPRALVAGRHRNEYWNPLTQISLSAGVLLMSIIISGSYAMRTPVLLQALNLTLAVLPVSIVVPPGFLFFFLYRRLWTAARRKRAQRDLARLRGEHVEFWARKAFLGFCLAISVFSLGLAVNAVLVFLVLRRIL